MKQHVLTLWVTVMAFVTMQAQAEFNLKAGVETWSLQDEKDLEGGSRHPGQFLGFDVFVEDRRFLFVPGFHYHHISVLREKDPFVWGFPGENYLHHFSIPLTFGYKILEASSWDISVLAGAEVTFFYTVDDNDTGLDDDMLHGVSTGWTGMLHTEVFAFITAEMKYHHAWQPIIKERGGSRLRGVTFAAGIKF
jgi:hypothetical protein